MKPTGLMTIGAFARASRLSAKALRLYDELGLLPPAHVDPFSGYRFYEPGQLERARLVAWLRRLDMPLARIREVAELTPGRAAAEIAAYWAEVETDTSVRRDLAAFLVDQLTQLSTQGDEDTMQQQHPSTPLAIRYAVRTDTGRVRPSNEDAAYAGSRLLAVADGFGNSDRAGSAAIEALKPLDVELPAGDLLNALADAVERANAAVGALPGGGSSGDGGEAPDDSSIPGTTLTAMLWSGSRLALVHIGDTRAYLLRDGELKQITHDHSQVQQMVDAGRITAEEARAHPQRALLLRALDGRRTPEPDLHLHQAQAGDRYLLCSDGLHAAVPAERIRTALAGADGPEAAVRELVDLANAAGGADNVACVVADVVNAPG